ncbi:MAG: hypothetical protein L6R38_006082 [Xanthoria sp. 2 TBL-2021]|nr:MAG: hypothetical protein L6R38_006082 [Xanthoria sp. 2 TBL-2021]
MQAAEQSNSLEPPNGRDLDAVLRRIDQFAGEYQGLLQKNKDLHVQKCIKQQKEYGEEVKDEAAKNPRDDERLSALMDKYCELDKVVKNLTTAKEDVAEMMAQIMSKPGSS